MPHKNRSSPGGQKRKYTASAIILVLSLAVAAGLIGVYLTSPTEVPERYDGEKKLLRLSAWLADWQWEAGLSDLQALPVKLDSLQSFAAYFDDQDKLLFTDEFHRMLPEVKAAASDLGIRELYLTVVNDIKYDDGSSVQKDSSLVARLTGTDERRKRHIEEIVGAVHTYGFDGVEIDYEKIAEPDWQQVILFYAELHQRLSEEGKGLRVVLEPRAPIERLAMPEGPSYVMMAYNLFGYHSGPGPKADPELISGLAGRIKLLPGEHYIALSAGGFDWRQDGKVTAVTYLQAVELAGQASEAARRDEASGSLYFRYVDEQRMEHTVWYADSETISRWIETAVQSGIRRIALWRLGETGETYGDISK